MNRISGVLPDSFDHQKRANGLIVLSMIVVSMLLRFVFMGTNDLLAEEAYYWNYAQHLDWGYLDHPPMVALLIKLSTLLFGHHEFSVRLMAMGCWCLTVYFSYRLTELMHPGSGLYGVMLYAILPFFFMYSLIMTPDVSLLACWSAALYFLYRALHLNHPRAWYAAGVALGLGMLSKYTISLLVPATLVYLLSIRQQRFWFLRKEPYLAALIACCLFTPVIYWNATHDWVSFVFQGTRRIQAEMHFSLHVLLGLLVLFLTPIGIVNVMQLYSKKQAFPHALFIKIYAFVPLGIFTLFSVTHEVKMNWIGPCMIALMPWIAKCVGSHKTKIWFITGWVALSFYALLIACLSFSAFPWVNQTLLNKYIDWNGFTQTLSQVADQFEKKGHTPVLIPLDTYSLSSELTYYQFRHHLSPRYPVMGAHRFNYESLMYRYWEKDSNLAGKYAIFIAVLPYMFENGLIVRDADVVIPPTMFWAYSERGHVPLRRYYYEVVRFNV